MDKLLFWLGIGAAQKGARSKPTDSRHPVTSFVVGVLIGVDNCRNVFCWSAKNYEVGATKFRRSHNHCDLLGIYSSVHRAHSFLI